MFCNSTALLTYGAWYLYATMGIGYNPWLQCPNTLQYVENTQYTPAGKKNPDSLADHIGKYSCYDRPYRAGDYRVDGCDFATFEESIDTIKRTLLHHHHGHKRRKTQQVPPDELIKETTEVTFPKKIYFVGDSLTLQLFIATRCALERYHLLDIIEPIYTIDIFLRNDIPCDPSCSTNTSLWNNTGNPLLTPCFNCREDGHPRDYDQDYLHSPNTWFNHIPPDTLAIILGSGAWYNNYKSILHHNAMYRDTLEKLKPSLTHLLRGGNHHHHHPLAIYWIGLPPIEPLYLFDQFDWQSFVLKDRMAAEVLEPVGVQFVNTTHLLSNRKAVDGNISRDGLHWCSPGSYSAPQFLSQIVLHLLAGHVKDHHSSHT